MAGHSHTQSDSQLNHLMLDPKHRSTKDSSKPQMMLFLYSLIPHRGPDRDADVVLNKYTLLIMRFCDPGEHPIAYAELELLSSKKNQPYGQPGSLGPVYCSAEVLQTLSVLIDSVVGCCQGIEWLCPGFDWSAGREGEGGEQHSQVLQAAPFCPGPDVIHSTIVMLLCWV